MIEFKFTSEYGEQHFQFKQPKPLRLARLQKMSGAVFYDELESYVKAHVISPSFEEAWEYIQELEETESLPEFSEFLRLMFGEQLQKKSKRRQKSSPMQ